MLEAPGASLPDPFVRFAPAPAHRFAETGQQARRILVEAATSLREAGRGVDHLAIDIELQLTVRVVADPHRARARVAVEMRQLALGEVRLAENVVEHLQLGPAQARRVQHPVQEGVRLFPIAQREERAQGERRVAQPAVAVVPIANAAERSGSDVVGAATIAPDGA